MDGRGKHGGICKLRELIEEHPAELAYDLRHLCNVSIDQIGREVSYRETALLIAVMLRNPESWLQAVVNGWKYPFSRDALVLADLYDLTAMVNSSKGKKPKPYPRPTPDKNTSRVGKTDKNAAEVTRLLARMNPKESDG